MHRPGLLQAHREAATTLLRAVEGETGPQNHCRSKALCVLALSIEPYTLTPRLTLESQDGARQSSAARSEVSCFVLKAVPL